MGLVFTTDDGASFNTKDYEFTIRFRHDSEPIGTLTVGGLRTGDSMTHDTKGMYFYYQDGTRYFVSYSWFK